MTKLSEQVRDMELLLEAHVAERIELKMHLYSALTKAEKIATHDEILGSTIFVDEETKQIRMIYDGREIAPLYETVPHKCMMCKTVHELPGEFCSQKCKDEWNDLPF